MPEVTTVKTETVPNPVVGTPATVKTTTETVAVPTGYPKTMKKAGAPDVSVADAKEEAQKVTEGYAVSSVQPDYPRRMKRRGSPDVFAADAADEQAKIDEGYHVSRAHGEISNCGARELIRNFRDELPGIIAELADHGFDTTNPHLRIAGESLNILLGLIPAPYGGPEWQTKQDNLRLQREAALPPAPEGVAPSKPSTQTQPVGK